MAFYERSRDPFRDRDSRGPFGFGDRDRFDRPYRDDRRLFGSRERFDDRGRRGMNDSNFRGADDLASKQLQIEAKKFYVDVKENKRGRFFKISEVSSAGQRNRIVFDLPAASDFHEQLTNFIEFFSSCDCKDSTKDQLKSEVIHAGERRYYIDLKANSRGMFLKVALTMPPPSNERQQIVIPAQGMADLRDALTELLSEFGSTRKTEKVESKVKVDSKMNIERNDEPIETNDHKYSMTADNKTFFFDVISTKDGHCLQISEVTQSFRTQINIPENAWPDFIDKLHVAGTALSSCMRVPDDRTDEQQLHTVNEPTKKSVDSWGRRDNDNGNEDACEESANECSNVHQDPTHDDVGAGGDSADATHYVDQHNNDNYDNADYLLM